MSTSLQIRTVSSRKWFFWAEVAYIFIFKIFEKDITLSVGSSIDRLQKAEVLPLIRILETLEKAFN